MSSPPNDQESAQSTDWAQRFPKAPPAVLEVVEGSGLARKHILNVREAATLCAVSPSTILGLIHSGRIDYFTVHDKAYRILTASMITHMIARYVPTRKTGCTCPCTCSAS